MVLEGIIRGNKIFKVRRLWNISENLLVLYAARIGISRNIGIVVAVVVGFH